MTPPLLSWTPSSCASDIDKDADYAVVPGELPIDLTPFTPFLDNGLRLRVSGVRLYYLLKNRDKFDAATATAEQQRRPFKKSLKNVCLRQVQNKQGAAKALTAALRMPDCIARLLAAIEIQPRGNRYRKRFIFNAYVANVLTCTKCNKRCIVDAMALLYEHEEKCTLEFDRLLYRSETIYKPPNCANMKNKDKLCCKTTACKGTNPICNF
ncbi:lef2 primase associated protein [Peridroma alphabaculovirus]|uniref:Lef2 primase associated protein n=1 Tax=Peridroma alphabaculovirus TaxID=1346829 RepID=A0A068LKM7_9ABAC|nr:lef2 primase associated protein [Peridroma alphabaculovirus]AIE47743.1 lef2 primase associated protein [Peridroma alphabaculovirus]